MAKITVNAQDVIAVQKELVSRFEIADFRVEDVDIETAIVKMFLKNRD